MVNLVAMEECGLPVYLTTSVLTVQGEDLRQTLHMNHQKSLNWNLLCQTSRIFSWVNNSIKLDRYVPLFLTPIFYYKLQYCNNNITRSLPPVFIFDLWKTYCIPPSFIACLLQQFFYWAMKCIHGQNKNRFIALQSFPVKRLKTHHLFACQFWTVQALIFNLLPPKYHSR